LQLYIDIDSFIDGILYQSVYKRRFTLVTHLTLQHIKHSFGQGNLLYFLIQTDFTTKRNPYLTKSNVPLCFKINHIFSAANQTSRR